MAGDSTRSGGTPARLLPITGDRHKGEAIDVEKGRYGRRWLRDDDDDDDELTTIINITLTSRSAITDIQRSSDYRQLAFDIVNKAV